MENISVYFYANANLDNYFLPIAELQLLTTQFFNCEIIAIVFMPMPILILFPAHRRASIINNSILKCILALTGIFCCQQAFFLFLKIGNWYGKYFRLFLCQCQS